MITLNLVIRTLVREVNKDSIVLELPGLLPLRLDFHPLDKGQSLAVKPGVIYYIPLSLPIEEKKDG